VFNKVLLFLLCGCCCTTIGFSLYFNDELNNSVGKLASLVKEYEEAVEGIGNSTTESQTIISSNIQLNLNNIERNYHEQQENTTETQSILKYLQSINYNLSSTWDEFNLIGGGLNTNRYSQLISIGERFRWFTVLSFYILFILINLLLIYGLVKNSKCSFITFSVLGLLVLIVNWCVVSGWLVVAVGTADTCSERNTTLLTELIPVEEIRTHLASVSFLLNSIRETTKELRSLINFNYNFNYIEINIINLFEYYSTIELSVGAIETHLSSIYTNYLIFKSSLCSTTLMHVHWLLVLNIGASFVLSLLIYIDSYVWIYLIQMGSGKRSPGGNGAKLMDEKYGEPSSGDKSRNSRGTACHPSRGQPGTGRRGVSPVQSSTLDHRHHSTFPRHQNGKYKTLNSNCKLLEASDYY
jgi:hypothetical protein